MSLILLLTWFTLPTAALSQALRDDAGDAAARIGYALMLWTALTGVLAWIAQFAQSAAGIAPMATMIVATVGLLLGIAVRQWRTRRAVNWRRSAPAGATALLIGAGLLYLFFRYADALATPSEVVAHSALARVLANGATPLLPALIANYGDAWATPLPALTQSGLAWISGAWTFGLSRVAGIAFWLALGLVAFGRTRLAFASKAACAAFIGIIVFVSVALAHVWGSDSFIVACLAGISALSLAAPARPLLAVLTGGVAFAWNPHLGWPVALAASAAAIAGQSRLSAISRAPLVAAALAALLYLIVAQWSDFFPESAWRPHLTSQWLKPDWFALAAALWLGFALAKRARAAGTESVDSPLALWLIVVASGAAFAALLSGAGVGRRYDAPLGALLAFGALPAVGRYLSLRINALNDYAIATQSQHTHVPTETEATAAVPLLSIDEMRERLAHGFNALQVTDFATATSLANEVIAADPIHPDAHHLLAHVALAENRTGDALREVQQAIDVYPEHALFYKTAARIYAQQARLQELVATLTEASRLDPNDMDTKTQLLMAKRKYLAQMAQRAQAQDEAASTGYAISVENKQKT